MYTRSQLGCSGCVGLGHDGLGDAQPLDPVSALQYQLNRYSLEHGAPEGFGFFDLALPVTGTMSVEWANRALTVASHRAISANDDDMNAMVLRGWFPDPAGFVMSNLKWATDIASNFADVNGLKPARMPGSGLSMTTLLIAGGIAAYLLFFRKRR